MPLSDLQMALLQRGIIELKGEIDQDMAAYVRDCLPVLAALSDPNLTVWVTSVGGSIIYGLDIYDMLSCYPGQTTGLVINEADSMAAVVLQACKKRLAHPNARLLIHDPVLVYLSVNALRDQLRLKRLLKRDARRIYDRTYHILSQRSGRTTTEIRRQCRKNETLFADEALRFGLIDALLKSS